jgi:hypothetical protein
MRVKLFLFFIAIVYHLSAFCTQDSIFKIKPSTYSIETKLHYGFIIRHHKDIAHLTNRHFPAYELNLVRQTNGNKLWQEKFAYPQIGISILYSTLGNNPYVGRAYSLTPYINFPLLNNPKLRICYRFGVGLSWLTRKFDVRSDYRNIAISTNVNASIRTDINLQLKINNLQLITGIGLSHYSDGGFKQPNLGFNVATAFVGMAYEFQSSRFQVSSFKFQQSKSQLKPYDLRLATYDLRLILSAGSKGTFPAGSKNHAVYNIESEYLKKVGYKSEIGGGVEIVYDFSIPKLLKQFGDTIKQGLKVFQPGIFIAYQLDISKLKLQFNIGTYLYTAYKENGNLYERLVLSYPLAEKMFVNLSLKSYYFKADVTEIGLGYKIK